MKRISIVFLCISLFLILGNYCACYNSEQKPNYDDIENPILRSTLINYTDSVSHLAKTFDLPASYLLALISLESGGRKKVPSRYEKKVYKKLLSLKKGKIKSFENIKQEDVKKLSKQTLKKMACSHGPFQIMGYKCFFLKVPLSSLTGSSNMFYAVKWISLTYGKSLRARQYKDAFHIHNTGKKYPKNNKPKTHDPNYIKNGLKYEQIFRKKLEVNDD